MTGHFHGGARPKAGLPCLTTGLCGRFSAARNRYGHHSVFGRSTSIKRPPFLSTPRHLFSSRFPLSCGLTRNPSGELRSPDELPGREEVLQLRIITQQPVDDLTSLTNDLDRQPDHRMQEASELHPQEFGLSVLEANHHPEPGL